MESKAGSKHGQGAMAEWHKGARATHRALGRFFSTEALSGNGLESNLCLGPKIVSRASFGVKLGGSDAENHEESEHRAQHTQTRTRKILGHANTRKYTNMTPRPPGVVSGSLSTAHRTRITTNVDRRRTSTIDESREYRRVESGRHVSTRATAAHRATRGGRS